MGRMTTPDLPDDLPPGALEAAAAAIHRLYSHGDPCGCTEPGQHEGSMAGDGDAASEAVWAAYPFIAAQAAAAERERCAEVADREALKFTYANDLTRQSAFLHIAGLLRQDGDTHA